MHAFLRKHNGHQNINDHVGATHTKKLQEEVVKQGAQLGLAFDGDADRCIAVDENGNEVDGDRIVFSINWRYFELPSWKSVTVPKPFAEGRGKVSSSASINFSISSSIASESFKPLLPKNLIPLSSTGL